MESFVGRKWRQSIKPSLVFMFFLFVCIAPHDIFAQKAVITMQTSKAVGEKVTLTISANGNVEILGVSNPGDFKNHALKSYTLTGQQVTIKGDILELDCSQNQITLLELSSCNSLSSLKCFENELTTLNLSECPKLNWLKCSQNKLSDLDLSKCLLMERLICGDNQLNSINITGCKKLQGVSCELNRIKDEDMKKLIYNLPDRSDENISGQFYVVDSSNSNEKNICNKLQTVIAKNKNWKVLYTKDNIKWEDYEGSNVPAGVIIMTTSKNKGETIKLQIEGTGDIVIEGVSNPNDYKNGNMITYNLKGSMVAISGEVSKLECPDNMLTDIDISDNPKIKSLNCTKNRLNKLNAAQCEMLDKLDCSDNQIENLNILNCTNLQELNCSNNKIIDLATKGCGKLKKIICNNNSILSINVADCDDITAIYCSKNQIRGIEMTNFVESLPDRSNKSEMGYLYVLDGNDTEEFNICNKNQVSTAKSKKWEVMYYKNNDWIVYEGSEQRPVSTITMVTKKNIGDQIFLGIFAKGNVKIKGVANPEEYKKEEFASYTITDQTITIEGDLEELYCNNGKLTSLSLKDCIDMKDLICYRNEISNLELSGCKSLEKIHCEKNAIKGEIMTSLVNNLPDRNNESNKGELIVINLDSDEEEANVMDKKQVNIAKSKNWKVTCIKNGYYMDYEGTTTNIDYINAGVVEIYPNPVTDILNIEGAEDNAVVSLMTMDGNVVATTVTSPNGQAKLYVASLPRGIYILSVGKIYKKLILE